MKPLALPPAACTELAGRPRAGEAVTSIAVKSWEPSSILQGSALALMLLSSFMNVVGDGIVFIKYPGDTMLGGAISAAKDGIRVLPSLKEMKEWSGKQWSIQ